ncbi:hypothetical protein KR200_010677 [Drosophila serrata]|nr:hypothetical protein KR200_010677 [Drosophila serrata]
MAYIGFYSNEQIIKSFRKRFKNSEYMLVSAEMLFLEELYMFLEESAALNGLSPWSIIESGKKMYKDLPKSGKNRYMKLAWEFNDFDLDV